MAVPQLFLALTETAFGIHVSSIPMLASMSISAIGHNVATSQDIEFLSSLRN